MLRKLPEITAKLWRLIARRSIIIPTVCAITVICITISVASLNTYIVYDGDRISLLNSNSENYAVALSEMGIKLSKNDLVSMPRRADNGIFKIHILRCNEISIGVDGQNLAVTAFNETVSSVLKRSKINVAQSDIVTPALITPVTDGMKITVTRVNIKQVEEISKIPYTVEKRKTGKLFKGECSIIQKGSEGQKRVLYELTLNNGNVSGKKILSEVVTKNPIKEIVEYGTKQKSSAGSLLFGAGNAPLNYKKVIEVKASAYTTEHWSRKTTATGAIARFGLIAVDPKVIPLGSKLYITSLDGKSWIYGIAIAADTGGSIKGNKIDLFFNTYAECISFGRRRAKVYILS